MMEDSHSSAPGEPEQVHGTLLEWDNARLDLRRAEVSLIQAQINLLLAHVRFRKAIGE